MDYLTLNSHIRNCCSHRDFTVSKILLTKIEVNINNACKTVFFFRGVEFLHEQTK